MADGGCALEAQRRRSMVRGGDGSGEGIGDGDGLESNPNLDSTG
jgi:hypothetical protein